MATMARSRASVVARYETEETAGSTCLMEDMRARAGPIPGVKTDGNFDANSRDHNNLH